MYLSYVLFSWDSYGYEPLCGIHIQRVRAWERFPANISISPPYFKFLPSNIGVSPTKIPILPRKLHFIHQNDFWVGVHPENPPTKYVELTIF